MKRIFQIGFNKSGTGSIHRFMMKNGIPSVHWAGGKLSKTICENSDNHYPLLQGYEDFVAFSDMEHFKEEGGVFYSGEYFFKELDKQYPGSLFILNYRNCDDWVRSRFNHDGYVLQCLRQSGMTVEEVYESWRMEYFNHIENVKKYFGDSDRFIELDIDNMGKYDLACFLQGHGFSIENHEFPHSHKTKKTKGSEHVNAIRDAAIYIEKYDIELAMSLMLSAKKLRKNGRIINKRIEWYKEILSRGK